MRPKWARPYALAQQPKKTTGDPASGGPNLAMADAIFFMGHRDVPSDDAQKKELNVQGGVLVENAIGAAARQAMLDRHTYAHRARQVEAVLGEHRAAALAAAE